MFKLNLLDFPLYTLFLYFILYSIMGWLLEVGYAYKNRGYFVNRGFLHGPLCPIYGSAAILTILSLESFKDNIIALFIAATILTTILEYITAAILENTFNTKWWDYSDDPLNYKGRVCFHFSLIWGAVSVFVVKIVQPIISASVLSLPLHIGIVLSYVLFFILFIDFASTLFNLIESSSISNKTYNVINALSSKIFNCKSNLVTSLTNKDYDYDFKFPSTLKELKVKMSNLINKNIFNKEKGSR